jgi:hypothetical protein
MTDVPALSPRHLSPGAVSTTQPQVPAAFAVEAPLQNRVPFARPHAPSALNNAQPVIVVPRPPVTHLRLDAQGRDARPRGRTKVTLEHVQAALEAMPGNIAGRVEPASLKPPEDLFDTVTDFGHSVQDHSDLRFHQGIALAPKGRVLLAGYYKRKYLADISLKGARSVEVAGDLKHLIDYGREQPGNVRCAHYFGAGHATALVYIREGGEEALLSFDSIERGSVAYAETLAAACADLAGDGTPIPVFQHARSIQSDTHSCWVYAMKAATTLTGHQRDDHGQHGDFLVPDLIARLQARSDEAPDSPGVYLAWALPELVKMAQSEKAVLKHAGDELNLQLMGSKPGVTLQTHLEKYTYDLVDDEDQAPHQMMDYMRQKGERLAEIIEIESFNQQIGEQLGKQGGQAAWSSQQQDLFATEMKKQVRGERVLLTVDQEIQKLQALSHDFEAFVMQAGQTAVQIEALTPHLGSDPRLAALPPAGLDELEAKLQMAGDRFGLLSSTLDTGWRTFTNSRRPHQWSDAESRAYALVGMPLQSRLSHHIKEVKAGQKLLVLERQRRKALADDDLVRQRPAALEVSNAIAEIAATSLQEFHAGAMEVLADIDRLKISLPGPGEAVRDLGQMTPAQLKDLDSDLRSHLVLLERLDKRCASFFSTLVPPSSDSDSDTDSGEDESEVESDGENEADDALESTGDPVIDSLRSLKQAHDLRKRAVDQEIALLAGVLAQRA